MGSKTPDWPEFYSLLNSYVDPALVIQKDNGRIILANGAFCKLSAYSQNDLASRGVGDLFPGIAMAEFVVGESLTVQLQRMNRPTLTIQARIQELDRKGTWFLLSLSQNSLELQKSLERLHQAELIFLNLFDEENLENALQKAVTACGDLFGTNLVSIFQAQSNAPRLNRAACSQAFAEIPQTIPSIDLIRLSGPNIWESGRRCTTELHYFARESGLSYLATIPLGQESAACGLLVVGGKNDAGPAYAVQFLEIAGGMVSRIFQYFILTDNLYQEVENRKQHGIAHKNVLKNIQEAIFFVDSDFRIREVNSATEKILGYSEKLLIGVDIESVLFGVDHLSSYLSDVRKNSCPCELENVVLHRRDGTGFPAKVRILSSNNEENPSLLMVILDDLSEQERSQAKIQQLEQLAFIGRITTEFTHEVNKLVNNIYSVVQLLEVMVKEDDPIKDLVNKLDKNCDRLTSLMENLLSVAPKDSRMSSLDLNLFLTSFIENWKIRIMRYNNISLYVQVHDNLPKVMGDAIRLEQVLTNLVTNALEAMSQSGGTLGIRASVNSSIPGRPHIDISISDTGPGIPDEMRSKMFKLFSTSKEKGTGVGLVIAQAIMTAHQGSIQIETFPDSGTIFHVFVPIVEGDPA